MSRPIKSTPRLNHCLICGSKNIERKVISESFDYKGYNKVIDNSKVIICKDCKESVFTDESSKMNEKILKDFIISVDNTEN